LQIFRVDSLRGKELLIFTKAIFKFSVTSLKVNSNIDVTVIQYTSNLVSADKTSDHISGTPILYYPKDRLVASLAIGICSGSGRHATKE